MLLVISLILLLSIVVESSVAVFPLTLVLICVFSLLLGESMVFLAFFSGILLDLFAMRLLGLDSIFFLVVCWLIGRYRKKIFIGNILYLLGFIALITSIYSYYFYRYVKVWHIIIAEIIAIILIYIINIYFPNSLNDKKKLSV
ncbi:hypothetical protein AUJ73_02220 [Candidatus Gottesmanbacteria bacterium CG1_02_37_22]|uniref:Rod shape-determining protein MreD n=2 Tax=Candidatus Gottesmaniibacteriota TaxID=1752720 RepID=A0A1J4TT79_9BACT|nr:MAG: hypothetical protein AUJ73_02220 [Candidatus Gottesmanbacteria bacterium CG1_02_37_22]